jgi:hypothetical protein
MLLRRLILVLLAAGALALIAVPALAGDTVDIACKDLPKVSSPPSDSKDSDDSNDSNDSTPSDSDCKAAPSEELPFTGSSDLPLAATAAVLIIGGGFAVWALRHRPSH